MITVGTRIVSPVISEMTAEKSQTARPPANRIFHRRVGSRTKCSCGSGSEAVMEATMRRPLRVEAPVRGGRRRNPRQQVVGADDLVAQRDDVLPRRAPEHVGSIALQPLLLAGDQPLGADFTTPRAALPALLHDHPVDRLVIGHGVGGADRAAAQRRAAAGKHVDEREHEPREPAGEEDRAGHRERKAGVPQHDPDEELHRRRASRRDAPAASSDAGDQAAPKSARRSAAASRDFNTKPRAPQLSMCTRPRSGSSAETSRTARLDRARKPATHVEAASVTQTEVEDHGLGCDALGGLQPCGRAVRFAHHREAAPLEEFARDGSKRLVVVDDEDATGLGDISMFGVPSREDGEAAHHPPRARRRSSAPLARAPARPIPTDPRRARADVRRSLEMTDEDIHDLLPTALQRHADENRDDVLPGEEYHDVTWDAPVRLYQTHFGA